MTGSQESPEIPQFNKDPDADLDYMISWAAWLQTGDSIASSEWIIPTGLGSHGETNSDDTATVWLTGGAIGVQHTVVNRITTAQGRVEDQTILVFIQQH